MPEDGYIPQIIIDPKTGDVHRAEDIIGELQAVLRKYGYVIAHTPATIVLGKITDAFDMQGRAVAHIWSIAPSEANWKQVDWTPKNLKNLTPGEKQ